MHSSLLVVFHKDFFLTDEIDFALKDCHIINLMHSFYGNMLQKQSNRSSSVVCGDLANIHGFNKALPT